MITAPAIHPPAPEKSATLLLSQWIQSYFTGQPHASATGDRTFPAVELLFNQAMLPKDSARPVLHAVFSDWPNEERWFRGSDLGTWEAVLAQPASGVSYGLCDGHVIESVHGKRRRSLPGTAIRWQASGDDLLEQTYQLGWTTIRTIPSAASLVWQRDGGDYVEKTDAGAEVRRITPAEALWDGALKVVDGRATLLWYAIIFAAGRGPRDEWAARDLASHLESLFRDPQATEPLQQRGMSNWKVPHEPRPIATTAAQARYLTTTCTLRYFIPREHTN